VKPIPVVFHIGPLQIHTYGIGLALTFWFAYRYLAKRLRAHGYPDAWLSRTFVWVIVASIVGARAVHVAANWHFYSSNVGDIFAIWHGGLSSFGGLLLGVPAGFLTARRWCRALRPVVAADLVATVLTASWALGRILGPQLMVAGGGRRTNSWIGMYYAGEVGKRIPVPLIQAAECFVIWVIALQVEKLVRQRGGPLGLVATAVVALWGLSRFFDEYVWLPHGNPGVAVEVASLCFVAAGALFGGWLIWRARRRGELYGAAADPWAAPPLAAPEAPSAEPSGETEGGVVRERPDGAAEVAARRR
jgi:prolipoprotein diacylglyceryltransferase